MTTMEGFRKIYPTEYYRKFLVQGVRPDGRGLNKIRKTTVSTGSITSASGSAFVKMGNTSVVAGIKLEVGNPHENQQQILINCELSPLCSPNFFLGKPSLQSSSLTSFLNSHVCGLVDPAELRFDKDGKTLWYVYIDVYCLDYDGNVYDTSLMAVMAALRNLQLPEGEIMADVEVIARTDLPQRHVTLKNTLCSLSFALFDDYTLADPTNEEEEIQSGSLTIVYNDQGGMVSVNKPGGAPIQDDTLRQCMKLAENRVPDVLKLIDRACATRKK